MMQRRPACSTRKDPSSRMPQLVPLKPTTGTTLSTLLRKRHSRTKRSYAAQSVQPAMGKSISLNSASFSTWNAVNATVPRTSVRTSRTPIVTALTPAPLFPSVAALTSLTEPALATMELTLGLLLLMHLATSVHTLLDVRVLVIRATKAAAVVLAVTRIRPSYR